MVAPTILIKINTGTEGTPTWTTVGASDTITFTGSGSSDTDLRPVPRPAGANKVHIADELWVDTGTDLECSIYEAGGDEVGDYVTDIFSTALTNTNYIAIQADTNPESQAGELEAWDDDNYNTTLKEVLNGTGELSGHSQLRAGETGSNVTPASAGGSIPGTYDSQTASDTTYQLQGSTRSITFSQVLTAGNQNRIICHCFTCADSTAGQETIELTYKFYYT